MWLKYVYCQRMPPASVLSGFAPRVVADSPMIAQIASTSNWSEFQFRFHRRGSVVASPSKTSPKAGWQGYIASISVYTDMRVLGLIKIETVYRFVKKYIEHYCDSLCVHRRARARARTRAGVLPFYACRLKRRPLQSSSFNGARCMRGFRQPPLLVLTRHVAAREDCRREHGNSPPPVGCTRRPSIAGQHRCWASEVCCVGALFWAVLYL